MNITMPTWMQLLPNGCVRCEIQPANGRFVIEIFGDSNERESRLYGGIKRADWDSSNGDPNAFVNFQWRGGILTWWFSGGREIRMELSSAFRCVEEWFVSERRVQMEAVSSELRIITLEGELAKLKATRKL